MAEGYQALTEKEKQTLRLIVRGHDAKSMARHLGLSVHTVNERLRDARRKLSVSSSREAARRLLDAEGADPDSLTDKHFGDADTAAGVRQDSAPNNDPEAKVRWAWAIGGVLTMSLILAMLALSSVSQEGAPAAAASQAAPAQIAATDPQALRSAQAWLALVDQGRWDDSWNAAGQAFKALNTSKTWARISKVVRPPLGAVLSRTAISQEMVPAPPHGYLIVKFRTSFANRPGATETVSLAREGDNWRVVGYWIA